MSGDKDLEQLKKEAAAKARAAALAKRLEKEKQEQKSAGESENDLAKQKAEAAAKARAAALAKKEAKAQQEQKSAGESENDLAKQKAEAAAKARAAALAKKEAKAQQEQKSAGEAENDLAKQKAEAAAKAKEAAKARAAAKAKSAQSTLPKDSPAVNEEEVPSANQPFLDLYIKVIEEHLGKDVLEDYYINTLSKDVPTIVVKIEAYYKVAEFLKYNEQLAFDYLSELHGTDFETHMEVYTHLYSYKKHQSLAFKVKIDRDAPMIDSLAPLWAGANWPECEAYDLLGIKFKGHPNLHRIMLGEDWVGHPLRKDYEPYDVEV